MLKIIITNSQILETSAQEWLKAAETKFQKRKTVKDFGLVDALILTKSTEMQVKIITTDNHFKNEKLARVIN
ncbi:MAG: hypothetical protein HY392_00065 [Candidatus Diapherotrites archaeon]|nr:hypothetical protein [Candidatus Diapherotrites archaeon]